ncbi:cytokinin dehydrogenase 3-like protein [Tanacetum coccineum]
MMVEKEKICSLEETTVPESFPTVTTPVTSTAGNAPGKSSYANITGKPIRKKVNVYTLFTPGGNGIDVVASVDYIRAISERFANTAYGFFLEKKVAYPVVANYNSPWFIRNNPLILKKWHPDENLLKEDVSTILVWVKLHDVPVTAFSEDGLSAIATKLVMIEHRADVELKDNIVVVMPKITKEGHYTCNVRVEYEWKPPRCSSCKVFGHIYEECPKNTSACEKKTMKKPSQTFRGVSVSNSNPFDVLNSVDNDEEFGTNGGTTNLVNNEATSSKLRLLDNDGNPLVPTGIVESDNEVKVVFDETVNLRISTSGKDGSDKGYDTNSLLEQ